MSTKRHAVTHLAPQGGGWALVGASPLQPVTLPRYARFKYGESRHLDRFAQALVRVTTPSLESVSGPLYVTSSGYGFTPPAAAALLDPAIAALRRAGWDARPFRTHRDSVTPADYATLNSAQRSQALGADQLHPVLPSGTLAGATVLGLDDVVVTGVHERALELALRREGAAAVLHAYLVDATEAACSPQVESWLNGPAGTDPAALLAAAHSDSFTPNSRFLKAVFRLPAPQRSRVFGSLQAPLLEWMMEGARQDRMDLVPDLADGVGALLAGTPSSATA